MQLLLSDGRPSMYLHFRGLHLPLSARPSPGSRFSAQTNQNSEKLPMAQHVAHGAHGGHRRGRRHSRAAPLGVGRFFLWYLAGFCSEMLAGSALRYTFAGAINRNSSPALARPPRPPLCWGLSVGCTSTFSSPSPAALAHFRGCIWVFSVRPPENYLKCW